MLKIKLFPTGKKHQRSFRIVVAERRSKYNGNTVADIGFVTPQTNTVQVDKEKLAQWIKNGAQVTLGVDKVLNPDKYPRKKKAKAEAEVSTEVRPGVTKAAEVKTVEAPVVETAAPVETPVETA